MALHERYSNILNSLTALWVKNPAVPPSLPDTASEPESEDGNYFHDPVFGDYRLYADRTRLMKTRKGMYAEYDEMDAELPEFHSALDIIADNATRGDSDGEQPITIKCEDSKVVRELVSVRDRLRLGGTGLWTLARDIAKYGERTEEVVVSVPDFIIRRLKPLPTARIIPQADKWGVVDPKKAFVQINDAGEEEITFHDWQVLYFVNLKSRADQHGTGSGYSIRKAFKQLRMMEDAVVIARLTRAHNRLAYMVDTGSLTPEEGQKHLKKVKTALRKRRTISQQTGKMDLSFNPLSIEEDVFVATNKESKADVKVLQGDLTVGNLADLEYFLQKVFTGLKVPKPYLAHEKDSRAKSVMTEQDIQFARSVRRIQSVIVEGLRKLFDFALTLRGIDPLKTPYVIGLPVISIVDDLRVWQTWQLKMLVSQMMKMVFWPSDEFILREILGMDSDDVKLLLKGQKTPDKFNGLYQAPKVGAVANNTKTSSKEELAAALAVADPTDVQKFNDLVTELRDLWAQRSAAA